MYKSVDKAILNYEYKHAVGSTKNIMILVKGL